MARPFFEILRELRNGVTLNELSDAMASLTNDVRVTGKGGKLMLTITVKPASKNDASTVLIDDEVLVKRPRPDRSATVFYSTANNELVRQDPKQRDFVLEPVRSSTASSSPLPPFDSSTGEVKDGAAGNA